MQDTIAVTSTTLLAGLRRENDRTTWERFCARYEPMLLACAQRAGLQAADARDAVQETLIAFVEGLRGGRFDERCGRLRAWLRGILGNKIREARRHLARLERQVVDADQGTKFMNRIPDEDALEWIFEEEWERAILAECLRKIRRQFNRRTLLAFKLLVFDGWTADRVAERMATSRNAVYVAKSRVLTRLLEVQREIAEIW